MAARPCFVALNCKARIHRIVADLGGKQIARPRINSDKIADFNASLGAHFAPERRNERNATRSSDLSILFMRIERRNRDAGQCPDVVEIDLTCQHVKQGFVGCGLGHPDDEFSFVGGRWTEARRACIGVAGDAKGILPFRDARDTGIKGRADRKQFTCFLQRGPPRLMFLIKPDAVATYGQGRAYFVDELADAGFATLRIDDRFGEQNRLARQPCGHPLLEPCPHGFKRTFASLSAAGPIELTKHALQEFILQNLVKVDR